MTNNKGPGSGVTPLITFVGYTRNDGYARLFKERLQLLVRSLAGQAERFQLRVELLLVEWNPPTDQPSIASLLADCKSNPYFTLRIVTVPPEYHAGIKGGNEKGLHPARALNVGYRRAKGSFLSPIASDAVLSDNVFRHIKSHGLDDRYLYRLDRIDVDDDILKKIDPLVDNLDGLANLLKALQLHRHTPLDHDMCFHYGLKPLHTNGCGDFLLMSRSAWHALHGQRERCGVDCLETDSLALHAAAASGLIEKRLPDNCVVYKLAHGRMFRHKTGPYRPIVRRWIEKFVNACIPHRSSRAIVRALIDVPRRKIEGLSGHFSSMERNLVLPARFWAWRGRQVRLNDEKWGLAGIDLPEEII